MTAPPPYNPEGKSREQLIQKIRDLEETCAMQDKAAQEFIATMRKKETK